MAKLKIFVHNSCKVSQPLALNNLYFSILVLKNSSFLDQESKPTHRNEPVLILDKICEALYLFPLQGD